MINVGDKVTGSWGGNPIVGKVIEIWESKGREWARVQLRGTTIGEAVPLALLQKMPEPKSKKRKHIPM